MTSSSCYLGPSVPEREGSCTRCEDIYVMPPAGELPLVPNAIRLTAGGGVSQIPASYTSARAGLVAREEADRLPQQSADRPRSPGGAHTADLPDEPRRDRAATPRQPSGRRAISGLLHNGNELCFHSRTIPRRDIYIVNVHGTGLTNLTSPTQSPGQTGVHGDNLRCDWSPKANAIAFVEQPARPCGHVGDRNGEIYVMNADGSDVVRLTDATGSDTSPAWSPKGDRIAFESNRSGRPEIWVMNGDGSEQERLTNFEHASSVNVSKATWSPKGDRIAFHRRVTPVPGVREHLELYTMNADGSDVPVRITFSDDPGFSGFPSGASGERTSALKRTAFWRRRCDVLRCSAVCVRVP